MVEIWKPVVGYEGLYSVSDQGRVRRDTSGRIRKPVCGSKGYAQATLSRDNKARTFLTHRLVMLAHVGPCPDDLEVCHRDGDRSNPALTNLRYDTRSANLLDRREHGTASTNAGETNGQAKLTEDDVKAIRAYPRFKGSRDDIAQAYGLNKSYISCIRTGKAWQHLS